MLVPNEKVNLNSLIIRSKHVSVDALQQIL